MSIPAISVGDVRSYNTSFGNKANKKNSNVNNQTTSSVPTSLKAIPLATLIALSPINSNVYASEKAMMASEDAMIEMVTPDNSATKRKTQDKVTYEDYQRYENYKPNQMLKVPDISGLMDKSYVIFRPTSGYSDTKKDDPELVIEIAGLREVEMIDMFNPSETIKETESYAIYPTELISTKDGRYFAKGVGTFYVIDNKQVVGSYEDILASDGGTIELDKSVFDILEECFEGDIPVIKNADMKRVYDTKNPILLRKTEF